MKSSAVLLAAVAALLSAVPGSAGLNAKDPPVKQLAPATPAPRVVAPRTTAATPAPKKAEPAAAAPLPAIGESLSTLTARYGDGLKNAFKIRIPGKDQYYWEMQGIGMNVVFDEDKAVLIVAHGVGHLLKKEEIRELLKPSSDIHGWAEDETTPRWLRRDGQLEAFREQRHEDMFFIRDIAAVEKLGHKAVAGSR